MNKEERSKLVWKYFWQQKWEEIKEPFLVFLFLFIPIFGLYLIYQYFGEEVLEIIGMICFLIALIIVVIVIIYIIFNDIHNWIKENWQRANRRARSDLK